MLPTTSALSPSAEKILQAATELFGAETFSSVSIKDIAQTSGVNSALISYYYGGKKNLYQAVLTTQANVFLNLIDLVKAKPLSSVEKLYLYIQETAKIQLSCPKQVQLIYRELLMPSGFCDNYVQARLYKIHKFLLELVSDGITTGTITSHVKPTYVAFTLESIIVFFFLTQDFARALGSADNGGEEAYLREALDTYLASITLKEVLPHA
ncbi:MAG: TetR family transcriptional regulator [Acidaminococcaceae bacterium]